MYVSEYVLSIYLNIYLYFCGWEKFVRELKFAGVLLLRAFLV